MIEILNKALQRKLNIICNNKTIRSGTLILFSKKDFYITLFLKIKNVDKKYEIPYPYDIIEDKKGLIFDYKIDTLVKGNKEKHNMMVNLSKATNSKFFNCELKLEYI
tara:strand:+ start:352 stop:672 length:321 start_codon:yes stop_codon:yes gene_type:complete